MSRVGRLAGGWTSLPHERAGGARGGLPTQYIRAPYVIPINA